MPKKAKPKFVTFRELLILVTRIVAAPKLNPHLADQQDSVIVPAGTKYELVACARAKYAEIICLKPSHTFMVATQVIAVKTKSTSEARVLASQLAQLVAGEL